MAAINVVADGLNAILNAQRAQKREIFIPSSKMLEKIVDIMVRKRYVDSVAVIEKGSKRSLKVVLKYDINGEGVMREIKRHSKSARRVYAKSKAIPRIKNGFATVIVSTPKGIMTGKEARERKLGGEIVCHVF